MVRPPLQAPDPTIFHNGQYRWLYELWLRLVGGDFINAEDIINAANRARDIVIPEADYEIQEEDDIIIVRQAGLTITLPDAASVQGIPYHIATEGNFEATVLAQPGQLILGEPQQILPPWSCAEVTSTGEGWIVT